MQYLSFQMKIIIISTEAHIKKVIYKRKRIKSELELNIKHNTKFKFPFIHLIAYYEDNYVLVLMNI